MEVQRSPHFKRQFQKLSPHLQKEVNKKLGLLSVAHFHSFLRTHWLHGAWEGCLAFSLRDGYRVIFEFCDDEVINLLEVGPHDIYRKR